MRLPVSFSDFFGEPTFDIHFSILKNKNGGSALSGKGARNGIRYIGRGKKRSGLFQLIGLIPGTFYPDEVEILFVKIKPVYIICIKGNCFDFLSCVIIAPACP